MDKVGFGTVNWIVLIVYLLAMLGVGAYFTKRAGKSTEAFFKAGGKIPGWAVGFSIFATTLSAITFMSTPEQAFLTDWSYAAGQLSIFAIVPLLIYFYIPFFRKLNVTTAYEYLEERFGVLMRAIGSILFIVFHIGRVAIVVYLPTLAITSVSNIDPIIITAAVGILCIIYTFLGGIEGVIWSDVIQGIVLLGGAILIVILGIYSIHGGFNTVAQDISHHGKIVTPNNFKWGTAAAFIPIVFLGNVFNSLQQYTSSQDVVQRYQTTESTKATKHSLWVNGILALSTIPIFYGMGTVLYSFYNHMEKLPDGFNTSAIVPYFIVTNLPVGLAGLLIVAIFAACQSTISSSLNSISACVITDFKHRFFGNASKRYDVWLARLVVTIAGIIGIAAALYLVATNRDQTWNLFLDVIGLFGVPIAGIFAVGIFTKRANTPGVLIGLILSSAMAVIANYETSITPFVVSTISFVGSFVLGYLASLFFQSKAKDTTGLTIFSKDIEYTRTTK